VNGRSSPTRERQLSGEQFGTISARIGEADFRSLNPILFKIDAAGVKVRRRPVLGRLLPDQRGPPLTLWLTVAVVGFAALETPGTDRFETARSARGTNRHHP
jgi:hypothetical protein